MANCLVTTLDWEWDNPNAERLGVIKMRVNNTTPATLKFTAAGELKLVDATWTATGLRTQSFAANAELVNFNYNKISYDVSGATDCIIEIPKYSCVEFVNMIAYNGIFDVDGFNYSGDAQLLILNCPTSDGTVNGDKIYNLKSNVLSRITGTFNVRGYDFDEPLDLTELGNSGSITSFNMYQCNSGNLSGSLDNLGKCNITSFLSPRTKNVSLDVVKFVNYQRAAGRTTGSLNIREIGYCTVLGNGKVLSVNPAWDTPLNWSASAITLSGSVVPED